MSKKTKPTKGDAIAIVSDTHCNSTVGLCPPFVNLDDGGTYHASPAQRELWIAWEDFWSWYAALSKGYRRIVIFNGDMIDLDTKGRSSQVVTRNRAAALDLTIAALDPALQVADWVYTIRGTAAHVGESGEGEELLAQDLLDTRKSPEAASWWHLRGIFSGVKLDVAHHGRMGGKPWAKANAANSAAAELVWQYRQNGWSLPHYAFRSHNHQFGDSGLNYTPLRFLFTPAWQLIGEYGYRIGRENSLPDIGGLALLCENGTSVLHTRFYPFTKEADPWLPQT